MNSSTMRKIIFIIIASLILLGLVFSFYETSIASSSQSQLSENNSDNLENEVSLTGHFLVLWGDQKPDDDKPGKKSESKEIFMLTVDDNLTIKILVEEKLLNRYGGFVELNWKRVAVRGSWIVAPGPGVSTPVLDVKKLKPVKDKQTEDAGEHFVEGFFEPAAVTGPQPWVSVLCKFGDNASEPQPLSFFQTMYDGTYPHLDHYWREISYNNINVLGSAAFGWFTLPQPRSYYVYDQDGDGDEELNHGRAFDDCTGIADPDVYYPDYVGINLIFNDTLDCCAWGGSRYTTLDGITQSWRVTWEPPWGWGNLSVMEHEMGHGFGFPHSSGKYGQVYDNPWDVMSNAWYNCIFNEDPIYGCVGQETIAYHKNLAEWIPPGQVYFATDNNPVTITLERLALPQNQDYLLAVIPIGGSQSHYYTVETRRLVGYDIKLPGNAVIIHEVDFSKAYIIDVDNNGDNGDDGAMWTVGETFYGLNGIEVTVESETPTGYTITIVNSYLEPDLVVDSITYSPSDPAIGHPVDITVQIRNQGSSSVSSTFWLDLYVDHQPTGCGDFNSVHYWGIDSIGAGEIQTHTYTHTFDSEGTFNIWAFVDSGCLIIETDETNNIYGPVQVEVVTPPLNDDFDDALIIPSMPYTNLQDTTGATTAPDDPEFTCVSGQKYNSIWYRYTPDEDGTLDVDTIGSDYDTVLAIWTGTRGNLTNNACNDDAVGLQSQVSADVTAGTTYFIEVAGFNSSAYGSLNLAAEFRVDTGPEMDVRWWDNNQSIADGDTTPSTQDGTDFGSTGTSVVHSFVIYNGGDLDLNLTGTPPVVLSGCSDFTVISQPGTPVISQSTTSFSIEFAPTFDGLCTATLSIDNDDADENPYDFTIQGVGDISAATVRAGGGTVGPGGSIVIPVEALDLPAVGLGAATVEIHYDNTVLDATGCTADPGGLFDSALCNPDYSTDTVRLTAISTLGVSVDSVLAEITFTAIGSSGDSSPLDVVIVTFTDPSGTPIPVNDEDGLVTIGCDVNCDGECNAIDALFILQREVGLRPNNSDVCPLPTDPPNSWIYLPGCDVSGDGSCNSVDALFILQCEVGIPNPFCPAPGVAAPFRQGWQPDVIGPLQTVTLNIGSGDVEPGSRLTVPLTTDLGDETLAAATVEIQYDPAVLEVIACTADPGGVLDYALCNIDLAAGKVGFTSISAAGVTGSPLLAEVTFQAIGNPGESSALTLTPTTFAYPSGQPISVDPGIGKINVELLSKIYLPIAAKPDR